MSTEGRAEVCSGRLDCSASLHVHGCYADFGGCDAPEEHRALFAKYDEDTDE